MTFCPVRQAPNRCKHCGEEKACSDMRKTKNCLHGHQPGVCQSCSYEDLKAWKVRSGWDPRVFKLREYGLTPEDYDRILEEQNGLCATCEKHPGDRNLDVDHCHETGRVRGLLCNNCNRALGYAKDDPKVLRRMAEYLEGGDAP